MNNLDELILEASDSDEHGLTNKLLDAIRKLPAREVENLKPGIELLMESWGDSVSGSLHKADFCLCVASLAVFESQLLRSALQKAFACLNESGLPCTSLIGASGIKNPSVPIHVAADRFRAATMLSPGNRAFNTESGRFGTVQKIDTMTSEIEICWDCATTSATHSRVPIEAALTKILFFKDNPELRDIASVPDPVPANNFREEFHQAMLPSGIPEAPRTVAMAMLSGKFPDSATFDAWWDDNSAGNKEHKTNRLPSEARSIQELHSLIQTYGGAGLTPEQADSLTEFFKRIKTPISDENSIRLIEVLVHLDGISDRKSISSFCAAVRGKAPFWPPIEGISGKQLALWSRVPIKTLAKFADITAANLSCEYLASIIPKLPLKCWNCAIQPIPMEMVVEKLMQGSNFSSDSLIWIWKNYATLPTGLVGAITPENILDAISRQISDPSSQASALKEMLLSNQNFQQAIAASVGDSPERLIHSVQSCEALRIDEKQSLLVKLSNVSSGIKSFLGKGHAKKIFASAEKKHIREKRESQLSVTSTASFNRLKDELDDIVSRQVPRNSADIAHARSYGDLRENAEYKAAKERQAMLSKRRGDLEKALNSVQVTDFSDVVLRDAAVPGSMVSVSYEGESEPETFFLLGVWDGDPEKKILSCVSRLGQLLNGKAVGDSFVSPDGRKVTVSAVQSLPTHIMKDIAG
ncbi:MAG: GreA/GreB family elongation factor [Victivallales bacterium]|nr:GreA/GreB family elongation factor [Victivallales bacterium]